MTFPNFAPSLLPYSAITITTMSEIIINLSRIVVQTIPVGDGSQAFIPLWLGNIPANPDLSIVEEARLSTHVNILVSMECNWKFTHDIIHNVINGGLDLSQRALIWP